MRFTIRQKPIIKSTVYAIFCLGLLLFSHSFFPALQLSQNKPFLLVGMISMLAYLDGVKYASFFAVIFGAVETMMCGSNILIIPLFYTVFAFISVWLYENFFIRNFLAWLCYTVVGLLIYSIISLFGPVTNWDIPASDLLLYTTVPTFFLSVLFSLPLFPILKFLKKQTDKER